MAYNGHFALFIIKEQQYLIETIYFSAETISFIYTEQKWKGYTTITYILWESIGQFFLLKLNNIAQASSKRFVETPPICLVWCMSYAPLSV